ncbi:MAG TPA: hypothetical protein PKA10_18330 [Selenomonadales bacterium]|nr:hypothetical protein [Selenomonadales bacterium]
MLSTVDVRGPAAVERFAGYTNWTIDMSKGGCHELANFQKDEPLGNFTIQENIADTGNFIKSFSWSRRLDPNISILNSRYVGGAEVCGLGWKVRAAEVDKLRKEITATTLSEVVQPGAVSRW